MLHPSLQFQLTPAYAFCFPEMFHRTTTSPLGPWQDCRESDARGVHTDAAHLTVCCWVACSLAWPPHAPRGLASCPPGRPAGLPRSKRESVAHTSLLPRRRNRPRWLACCTTWALMPQDGWMDARLHRPNPQPCNYATNTPSILPHICPPHTWIFSSCLPPMYVLLVFFLFRCSALEENKVLWIKPVDYWINDRIIKCRSWTTEWVKVHISSTKHLEMKKEIKFDPFRKQHMAYYSYSICALSKPFKPY